MKRRVSNVAIIKELEAIKKDKKDNDKKWRIGITLAFIGVSASFYLKVDSIPNVIALIIFCGYFVSGIFVLFSLDVYLINLFKKMKK